MKKYLAFTFIEMMVALAVFSVGVLAVMRLIMQNLGAMDNAETTTIASFLAKEGLELVYSIRDSNIQKGLPWHCVLDERSFGGVFDASILPDDACITYFSSGVEGRLFLFGFSSGGYFSSHSVLGGSGYEELFNLSRLYHVVDTFSGKTISWYGYSGTDDQKSFFARYVVFTGVQMNNHVLPLENIIKVESHVIVKKGSLYKDIVLESFVGKY